MSTDVRTQTGQGPQADGDDAAAATGTRENPQAVIQESIKYRRRAQEAERRAEALEAELADLRDGRDGQAASLEAELAQTRAEAESLRGRLQSIERDRQLERELLRAGCADTETALALAQQRLAGGSPPEDLAAFARALLEEKPHLRGNAAAFRGDPASGPASGHAGAARTLPPRSAAARSTGDSAPHRAAQRLAHRARETGGTGDLVAYMRARRGA